MQISLHSPIKITKNQKRDYQIGLVGIGKDEGLISLEEKFKGQVVKAKQFKNKKIGEDHPFNYKILEELYKKHGYSNATVNKFVDFITGGGFYVRSTDPRAEELVTTFLRDVQFDSILRPWVKEALIKGTSYIEIGKDKNKVPTELKPLNSNNIYIKRDDLGAIEEFNQIFESSMVSKSKEEIISFKPEELAHVTFNKVGDSAYGLGILYPVLDTIEGMGNLERSMNKLYSRKAGMPIHFMIGNSDKGISPSQAEVDRVKDQLQTINNRTEFITDDLVKSQILDFGSIGDKFETALRFYQEAFFAGTQIPEVFFGTGRVPEGLADVQMDAFERRVSSMQAELEKVIEQQIIRPYLLSQGLNVHVEFEWGQPSRSEINERLTQVQSLLSNSLLSLKAREMLEAEAITLLGLDPAELEEPATERDREENEQQPKVPGQNREEESTYDIEGTLLEG